MSPTPFIASFHRVDTYRDALVMRSIRNECRAFMTNDRDVIGFWKQFRFWRMLKTDRGWEAWIMHANQKPIGYGIISQRDHLPWVSGGLTEFARGLGYGKELFRFLTNRAQRHGPKVYLEVLASNEPAIRTYEGLSYKRVGQDAGVITMVHVP